MANEEHLNILMKGRDFWNDWRKKHKKIVPDLSEAGLEEEDLRGFNLSGANLRGVDLSAADLSDVPLVDVGKLIQNIKNNRESPSLRTDLSKADLSGATLVETLLHRANLNGANLSEADLGGAQITEASLKKSKLYKSNLSNAHLAEADLTQANVTEARLNDANLTRAILHKTDMSGAQMMGCKLNSAELIEANLIMANLMCAQLRQAKIIGANLINAILVRTALEGAIIEKSYVYGVSAWDISDTELKQKDLIISLPNEPRVTVDNIELAQFINLMRSNPKIKGFFETVKSKIVLILGRFEEKRKVVLDAIQHEIKDNFNYVPVIFEFDVPKGLTTTETIETLAGMSRFILADITDAKCVLQELRGIVPDSPSLPVKPLILEEQEEPGMFDFFQKYEKHFLETFKYKDQNELVENLGDIIKDVEKHVEEIASG